MDKDIKELLEPCELYTSDLSDEDEKATEKNEIKAKLHDKLVEELSKLSRGTGRSIKKPVRSEPSKDVSEFTWVSGKGDKVKLHDLVKSLSGSSVANSSLKKNLEKLQNDGKPIETPLAKPQLERVARTVAYEESSKDISKWALTVVNNRKAEHLSFPLQSFKPPKPSIKTMVARKKHSRTKTPLEEEIEAVLKGSSYVLERKNQELTAAEEEALKNVDIQEALERRKELQRLRVLQSYYETKCKRVKKIKSKKYHRIQKKEKRKNEAKTNLEELASSDPALFESELDKAEKMRAMERASLKHRNTSKWAKNLITRGHLSTRDKQAINEQLRISKALTEHKLQQSGDESEDDEDASGDVDNLAELKLMSRDTVPEENPWLLSSEGKEIHEKEERVASLRLKKLTPIVNKESFKDDADSESGNASSGEEWDEAGMENRNEKDSSLITSGSNVAVNTKVKNAISKDDATKKDKTNKKRTKKKTASISEKTPCDDVTSKSSNAIKESGDEKKEISNNDKDNKEIKENFDKRKIKGLQKEKQPNTKEGKSKKKDPQFVSVEKNAVSLTPVEEEHEDDEENDLVYAMSIKEAFANDDVIEEFASEKIDVIDKAKPMSVDLTLPGWGEWGGTGLEISKKKRRKFTKKVKEMQPRKDEKLPLVIMNEDRSSEFAKKQISSMPFPFTTKGQFERSMRHPIGPNWNTPSATSKLTQPRVEKSLGTMIDPIKATKSLKKKHAEETSAEASNATYQDKKKKKRS